MKKRVLSVFLSLCMLLTLVPITAFAGISDSADTKRYKEMKAYSLDALSEDAKIRVYATYNAVDGKEYDTIKLTSSSKPPTTFSQGEGWRQFTATEPEGWEWAGWTYHQWFKGEDLMNRVDEKHLPRGPRYSFSEYGEQGPKVNLADHWENWRTSYDTTFDENGVKSKTISINRLTTAGEINGIPITYEIFANFNPIITAEIDENGTITDVGEKAVVYGEDKTFEIKANDGFVIDSVLVDGKEVADAQGKTDYNYSFEEVIEPHSIVVKTAKVFTVTYTDGVDDEEVFADQVYSELREGSATPKFDGTPSREGYTFKGWTPEIVDTVTSDAVYTAQWEKNDEQQKPTNPQAPDNSNNSDNNKNQSSNVDNQDDPSIPNTGNYDNISLAVILAIAIVACASVLGVVFYDKKRKKLNK